jgi:threonine dehydratase
VADALLLEHPAPTCFELCRRLLQPEAGVVVTEEALCHALYLLDLDGIYAEPSAAAGVAALLSGAVLAESVRRVGVIVTGRNIEPERHRVLCERGRAIGEC